MCNLHYCGFRCAHSLCLIAFVSSSQLLFWHFCHSYCTSKRAWCLNLHSKTCIMGKVDDIITGPTNHWSNQTIRPCWTVPGPKEHRWTTKTQRFPPEYQFDAVFYHFITTFTENHCGTSQLELFSTQILSFPFAWNETPTLTSEPPTQPSQCLCPIPHCRFYDEAKSYQRYLLGSWHNNQRPIPSKGSPRQCTLQVWSFYYY